MLTSRYTLLALVALLVAAIVVGCGGGDDESSDSAPVATTESEGAKSTADGGSKSTADGGSKSTADGGSKTTADGGSKTTADGGSKTTADGGAKGARESGARDGGGEGGGGSSGGAGSSADKAAFLAKANAVCEESSDKIHEALRPVFDEITSGELKPSAAASAVVNKGIAPGLELEVVQVRAQGIPSADEAQVEAILASIEETVKGAKEDPQGFLRTKDPYGKPTKLAAAYGLDACGHV